MLSFLCLFTTLVAATVVLTEYSYPKGLPCKVYDTTRLDCSRRKLLDIPPLSHSTVKNLDLSHNLLELFDAETLVHLTSIEELDLSHNHLQNVTWRGRKLGYSIVKTLNLSYNLFELFDIETLVHLSSLEELDLSHNRLQNITWRSRRKLGYSTVKSLDLSYNLLESLDGEILNRLTSLEELNLSHNQFQFLNGMSFTNLNLLKELYLSHNVLSKISFDVQLPILVLDLSYNEISNISTDTFARLHQLSAYKLDFVKLTLHGSPFNSTSKLRVLDLSYSKIFHISTEAFAGLHQLEFLNISSQLECISFSCFGTLTLHGSPFYSTRSLKELLISNSGVQHLPKAIFSELYNLEMLHISLNFIYVLPSDAFMSMVNLKYLDLHSNYLLVESLPGTCFFNLISLKYLDMSCVFWPGRFISLPDKLCATLSHLQYFSINTNMLSALHVNTFPCNLGNLTSLKELRVVSDYVNYWNESTWSQMLSQLPPSLYALDLIIDDGVTFQSVTPGSLLSSSVLSFNISYCEYPLQCYLLVEDDAFSMFPSLQHITIQSLDRRFASKGSYLYRYAFRGLKSLNSLELHHNYFTELSFQSLEVIADSLKHLDLSHNSLKEVTFDLKNISFQLETLDISDNPISELNISPLVNVSHVYLNNSYPSRNNIEVHTLGATLQYLYISGRDLISFSYIMNASLCTQAPQLEEIILSKFEFSTYHQLTWGRCLHLRLLAISDSKGVLFDTIHTRSFPLLENLTLTNCKLSRIKKELLESYHLHYLDFSWNKLESLPAKQIQHMSSLTYLNLRGNKFVSLNVLKGLRHLEILYVDENALGILPSFLFKTQHNLQLIGFGNNSYYCNCDNIPLQDWVLNDRQTYIEPQTLYFCTDPPNSRTIGITDFSLDCSLHLEYYIPPAFIGLLVICIVSSLVYKYRRHIQFQLWVLFYQRRYQQYLENDDDPDILNEEEEDNVDARRVAPILRRRYHAYVAYHRESDEWVNEHLIPNIEDGPEQFRLCMKERGDVPPGKYILNAICHGIYKSRKTIIVLSENFTDDGWCHYQLQIAQMRMVKDKEDVIILVQIGEIPENKKTLLLRQILRTKGVLEWTEDADGQALFWNQLKMKLRKPIRVDRRIQEV